MKQDNGGVVVIMGRNKYFDKCYALLISELFVKSNQDPTAPTERKVKQILQKIKQKLPKEVYEEQYSTRSSPRKIDKTAEIHKLSPNQGIH